MRIIIVQAEIELAIKSYILNQIALKEGQEITIDFKATRGDDGATAEINISTPDNFLGASLSGSNTSGSAGNGKPPQKPVQSAGKSIPTKTAGMVFGASPALAVAETTATTSNTEASATDASTNSEAGTKEEEVQVQEAVKDPSPEVTETTEVVTEETKAEEPFTPPSFLTKGMDAATGATSQEEAAVSKPTAAAAEGEAKPASKSLFANLVTPVNKKSE